MKLKIIVWFLCLKKKLRTFFNSIIEDKCSIDTIRKDTKDRFNRTNAWISRMANKGKYIPELQMGDFHKTDKYTFKSIGW